MIRAFQDSDLDVVMSIWLSANIGAHNFIDAEYWKRNFDTVKTMIPQAEVYVLENDYRIDGFIGAIGDYIAGIFVDSAARACGIGSQLLDSVRKNREKLTLSVYQKNTAAVSFYLRRGFRIDAERIDPQTLELEYTMSWEY